MTKSEISGHFIRNTATKKNEPHYKMGFLTVLTQLDLR